MKKTFAIALLALIISCTSRDNNSVFLWKYKTKSELRAIGFKPVPSRTHGPHSKNEAVFVMEDWLFKVAGDTGVYYWFYNDTLLNRMISIQPADSARLFSFLDSLGFVQNGEVLSMQSQGMNFKIHSIGNKTHYMFTQVYHEDNRPHVNVDSVSAHQ